MIRRTLTGAVLIGAVAVTVAPDPGPLGRSVSAQTCRAGGGTPLFSPVDKIAVISTTMGTCLGGAYSLAAVRNPRGSI